MLIGQVVQMSDDPAMAFVYFFGGNLVSWSSKKQSVVSQSSTESEYRALALVVAELTWMYSLLRELGVELKFSSVIWCDNQGVVSLAANPLYHARTKHIEIGVHFVRDKVLQKILEIHFVPSIEQVADVFTKPLSTTRFLYLKNKLKVDESPFCLKGHVKTKMAAAMSCLS